MKIRAQIAMVLNLDKCIGCHTCSITCKNVWTNREGMEYVWFNNVETKPGIGYPKDENLYQASRAATYLQFAPVPVVRRGGVIVLPAACPEAEAGGSVRATIAHDTRRRADRFVGRSTRAVVTRAALRASTTDARTTT